MSRKQTLIAAIERYLNGRIETGRALPDMTPEIEAAMIAKRDGYLAKASAQPESFYEGCADVRAAMVKLQGV